MSAKTSPEDIRRWAENLRAVEERARDEARERGYVADSIAASLDLIAFASRLHGWPLPRDPLREREDEAVRDTWQRLREAFSRR